MHDASSFLRQKKKGTDKDRCEARLELLVNELNVVSGRLDISALLAGSDDGDDSFDKLGLSPASTIEDALRAIEGALSHSDSTQKISAAGYVARRIYTYYEKENTQKPACVYDPEEANECSRDRDREDDKDNDDEHDSDDDRHNKSSDTNKNHENSDYHESLSGDQNPQQSLVIQSGDQPHEEASLPPIQQTPPTQEPLKDPEEPEQHQEMETPSFAEPQATTEPAPDPSNTNTAIPSEPSADQSVQPIDPTSSTDSSPEATPTQEPASP